MTVLTILLIPYTKGVPDLNNPITIERTKNGYTWRLSKEGRQVRMSNKPCKTFKGALKQAKEYLRHLKDTDEQESSKND